MPIETASYSPRLPPLFILSPQRSANKKPCQRQRSIGQYRRRQQTLGKGQALHTLSWKRKRSSDKSISRYFRILVIGDRFWDRSNSLNLPEITCLWRDLSFRNSSGSCFQIFPDNPPEHTAASPPSRGLDGHGKPKECGCPKPLPRSVPLRIIWPSPADPRQAPVSPRMGLPTAGDVSFPSASSSKRWSGDGGSCGRGWPRQTVPRFGAGHRQNQLVIIGITVGITVRLARPGKLLYCGTVQLFYIP